MRWFEMWLKYDTCPYCHASPGDPCRDQRWQHKSVHRGRRCKHPHPERKLRKSG